MSATSPSTVRHQRRGRRYETRQNPRDNRAVKAQVIILRCAPTAALMASVLGNNSRASGAQSGQVKCKFKRRRRRRCKRKGKLNSSCGRFVCLCFFCLQNAELARNRGRANCRTLSSYSAARDNKARANCVYS